MQSGRFVVRHLTLMAGTAALIVTCMVYPFLPGKYNGLATTLSAMAQLFGMADLMLVPVGAAWLVYELRVFATHGGTPPGQCVSGVFARCQPSHHSSRSTSTRSTITSEVFAAVVSIQTGSIQAGLIEAGRFSLSSAPSERASSSSEPS